MADSYGSHPYVGHAIKTMPREKITLLTKIWTHEDGSDRNTPVSESLDRYREEMGTDYLDIVLMHCLMQPGWSNNRNHCMDNTPDVVSDLLGKAKKKGIGVIGMKIFGEGRHVGDHEREQSIKYALSDGNTHCMTLGLESIAQVDDAVERVMRLA